MDKNLVLKNLTELRKEIFGLLNYCDAVGTMVTIEGFIEPDHLKYLVSQTENLNVLAINLFDSDDDE